MDYFGIANRPYRVFVGDGGGGGGSGGEAGRERGRTYSELGGSEAVGGADSIAAADERDCSRF